MRDISSMHLERACYGAWLEQNAGHIKHASGTGLLRSMAVRPLYSGESTPPAKGPSQCVCTHAPPRCMHTQGAL